MEESCEHRARQCIAYEPLVIQKISITITQANSQTSGNEKSNNIEELTTPTY